MRNIFTTLSLAFFPLFYLSAQDINIDSLVTELKARQPEYEPVDYKIVVTDKKSATQYIIKIDKWGVSTIYKQVTYTWGGVFYFKNGQSINNAIFVRETMKEEKENTE